MWGSTRDMVRTIAEILLKEGVDVKMYDLAVSDIGDVARELVDSRSIIIGAPTVLGGMHPLALYGTYLIKALNPPAKYGVVLGSFGLGRGGDQTGRRDSYPFKNGDCGKLPSER